MPWIKIKDRERVLDELYVYLSKIEEADRKTITIGAFEDKEDNGEFFYRIWLHTTLSVFRIILYKDRIVFCKYNKNAYREDFNFSIDNTMVNNFKELTEDDWNILKMVNGLDRNHINIFKVIYRVIHENKIN